jgi:hypothetical protein
VAQFSFHLFFCGIRFVREAVIGTFTSTLNTDLIQELSRKFVTEQSWTYLHASDLQLLIQALGSLLAGIGAYLGFRKPQG